MSRRPTLFFCPRCKPVTASTGWIRGGTVLVAIDHCDGDYSLYCVVCKFMLSCDGCPFCCVFNTTESADKALADRTLYEDIQDSGWRAVAYSILAGVMANS